MVKWSLYRNGVAQNGKCLQCVTIQKIAYPNLDWNACKLQHSVSNEFKKEWEVAQKILEGAAPHFTLSSFDNVRGISAEVEKHYTFIPESRFQIDLNIDPKRLPADMPWDFIETKRGETLRGLQLEADPHYHVKVVHKQGTWLATHVQPAKNELRPARPRRWRNGITQTCCTARQVASQSH